MLLASHQSLMIRHNHCPPYQWSMLNDRHCPMSISMIKILQWCWQSSQTAKFRSRQVKNLIVSIKIKITLLTSKIALFHISKIHLFWFSTKRDRKMPFWTTNKSDYLNKENDSPPRLHLSFILMFNCQPTQNESKMWQIFSVLLKTNFNSFIHSLSSSAWI